MLTFSFENLFLNEGNLNYFFLKASIIVLTYNHENFIAQCIESLLVQRTSFKYEIIIANDHSTDKTEDVVEIYRSRYPGLIKGFNNKKNLRPRFNLMKAYKESKGEYIAYCEGDDYWTDPCKLQNQIDFLERNQEYVLCYHDIRIIDAVGNNLSGNSPDNDTKRDYNVNEMFGVYIPTPTMVYRKVIKTLPSVFRKTDNADTLILATLTKYGKARRMTNILPSYVRKHPGGIWTSKKHLDRLTDVLKLRYLIFQTLPGSLKPATYPKYTEIFESAITESLQKDSPAHWYKYNFRYVQFSMAAGKYGRAWLLSKRMLKRYLGFKKWLPGYHLESAPVKFKKTEVNIEITNAG